MKKVLILVFSNLRHDARVMRQINMLKNSYSITVCCYDNVTAKELRTITLDNKLTFFRKAISAVLLLLKRFSWAHHVLYPHKGYLKRELNKEHFNLIIANDIETLPFAFQLKESGTKIIFDAHEYAPLHFEDKFWWRVFFQDFNFFLCRTYIPKVHGMMTIGEALAHEYEKNFGIKPVVITNAGPYHDLQPIESESKIIRLVHHGIVNRSRRIELIIDILERLPDNFTLDLILVVSAMASPQTRKYLEELKQLASKNKRIRFIDPVPIDKIVSLLRQYDMGIILAPPVNFNYSNGLPNKLFDYIQARIGVATWPTPEIAKIVNDYSIGVVADDFTPASLIQKLALLDRAKVQEFKKHSSLPAKEFNEEKNGLAFNKLVEAVLKP